MGDAPWGRPARFSSGNSAHPHTVEFVATFSVLMEAMVNSSSLCGSKLHRQRTQPPHLGSAACSQCRSQVDSLLNESSQEGKSTCRERTVAADPCPERAQTHQPGATSRDSGDPPQQCPERATQPGHGSAPVTPFQSFSDGGHFGSRGVAEGWHSAPAPLWARPLRGWSQVQMASSHT
jgi:hypothetical protein